MIYLVIIIAFVALFFANYMIRAREKKRMEDAERREEKFEQLLERLRGQQKQKEPDEEEIKE